MDNALFNALLARSGSASPVSALASLTGGDPGDGETVDFVDSLKLKSGKYPKARIVAMMKAAKAVGVDPLEVLGVELQEDAFGKGNAKVADERNRSRRNRLGTGNVNPSDFSEKDLQFMNQLAGRGYDMGSLKLAMALKSKNAYAKQLGFKDDALRLQGYNGYGTITRDMFGGADKAYGVPIGSGIDMKKNPLYGKRILQLKADLSKNKAIIELLRGL